MAGHFLMISPKRVVVGLIRNSDPALSTLAIQMELDASQAPFLAPDVELAIEVTPEIGRFLGQLLLDKADELDASRK